MSVYSFIAIKPDGVQVCRDTYSFFVTINAFQGDITIDKGAKHACYLYSADSLGRSSQDSRSEGRGSYIHHYMYHAENLLSYKLAAMKLVTPSKEHLEKHYEDLADKPFYKGLVTCTSL